MPIMPWGDAIAPTPLAFTNSLAHSPTRLQARALGISRGVLVLDVPRGSAVSGAGAVRSCPLLLAGTHSAPSHSHQASKSGLLGSSRSDTGQVLLGDVITGVNGERV